MQIEQEQNSYPASAADTSARQGQVAAQYVAVFPTRLALARWTMGGDIPHVFSSTRCAPLRAAWYAQAQRDFQSWLEEGGFHRAEHAVEPPTTP